MVDSSVEDRRATVAAAGTGRDRLLDLIRSTRFGLGLFTGSFSVDPVEGAAVMIRLDVWWGELGPIEPFFDLQDRLLGAVSSPS